MQLERCRRDLERERARIAAVFEAGRLDPDNFSWVSDDLATVSQSMLALLEEINLSLMEEIIWTLTNLMHVQPTVVNQFLINSVQILNLAALQNTLLQIYNRLLTLGKTESQLLAFKRGADDLVSLNNDLNNQIREHRTWQKIDTALQQADNARQKSDEDLKRIWRILSPLVQMICNETAGEDWSEQLFDTDSVLNNALASNNKEVFNTFFPGYKSGLRTRFYEVDSNLKILCEKLRPIGDKVHEVLQALESYE